MASPSSVKAILGLSLHARTPAGLLLYSSGIASSSRSAPSRQLSTATGLLLSTSQLRARRRPALEASSTLGATTSSRRGFSSTPRTSEAASSSSSSALEAAASPATQDLASSYLAPLVPYIHDLPAYLHLTPGPHSYALSILLLTLLLRAGLTLPATIWQRGRTRRMAEDVMPRWKVLKEKLPEKIAKRCRREGKSYEEFQKVLQTELKGHLKQLLRIYKCSPLPSILVPLAVQVPLFLLLSSLLRQAVITPDSPLLAEVIPWWSPPPELTAKFAASVEILRERGLDGEALEKLTKPVGPSLGDKDRTMLGPIGAGLIMLANVELGQWSRRQSRLESQADAKADAKAAEAESGKKGEEKGAVQKAEETELEPIRSVVAGNMMRALSIVFVPLLSISPGAIVVYCLSTFSFTLLQNAAFTIIDRRRALRLRSASPALAAGSYSPASGSNVRVVPGEDAMLSSLLSGSSSHSAASDVGGASPSAGLSASGNFVRQVPTSASSAAGMRMGGQIGAGAGRVASGDAAAAPGLRRARVGVAAEAMRREEERSNAARPHQRQSSAAKANPNSAKAASSSARRRRK